MLATLHSFLFIRTSKFRAEAEPRPNVLIFWRFQPENVLNMFLNREHVYTVYVIEIHVVTIKNVHSSILNSFELRIH